MDKLMRRIFWFNRDIALNFQNFFEIPEFHKNFARGVAIIQVREFWPPPQPKMAVQHHAELDPAALSGERHPAFACCDRLLENVGEHDDRGDQDNGCSKQ